MALISKKVDVVNVALLAAPKYEEGVRGREKMSLQGVRASKLEVCIGFGGRSGRCKACFPRSGFVLQDAKNYKTNLKVPKRAFKRLQRLLVHRSLNNSQSFLRKCRFKSIFGRRVDIGKRCIEPLKEKTCFEGFYGGRCKVGILAS